MQENNWQALILLLKEIAKDKGMTYQEIADKTGMLQPSVARFFMLTYKPKLDTFLKIATAIDVNFFFESKDSKTDLNILFERAMEELGRRPGKLPKN